MPLDFSRAPLVLGGSKWFNGRWTGLDGQKAATGGVRGYSAAFSGTPGVHSIRRSVSQGLIQSAGEEGGKLLWLRMFVGFCLRMLVFGLKGFNLEICSFFSEIFGKYKYHYLLLWAKLHSVLVWCSESCRLFAIKIRTQCTLCLSTHMW